MAYNVIIYIEDWNDLPEVPMATPLPEAQVAAARVLLQDVLSVF